MYMYNNQGALNNRASSKHLVVGRVRRRYLRQSVWVKQARRRRSRMQRYTAREIWQMEDCQSPRMGCSVVLGVDGGASNTVCVCIPAAMPFADPLPVLSRAIAGCSNQNSVGGTFTRPAIQE
jgi:hypothetical protein